MIKELGPNFLVILIVGKLLFIAHSQQNVENSCSIYGFGFMVTCCGSSDCVPAKLKRKDIDLGPEGRAFNIFGDDYIYVKDNSITAGSRIKGVRKGEDRRMMELALEWSRFVLLRWFWQRLPTKDWAVIPK